MCRLQKKFLLRRGRSSRLRSHKFIFSRIKSLSLDSFYHYQNACKEFIQFLLLHRFLSPPPTPIPLSNMWRRFLYWHCFATSFHRSAPHFNFPYTASHIFQKLMHIRRSFAPSWHEWIVYSPSREINRPHLKMFFFSRIFVSVAYSVHLQVRIERQ